MRAQLVRSFTHAALSPDPDLAIAALMIARVECPRLDAGPYLDQLDTIGREAERRVAAAPVVPGEAPLRVDPERYARVIALNEYLFKELRFVGNDVQYEDPRNSFLNEVLDRRTGIPITLAMLYMEVARRAGLYVEGINFPGHFLVRCPDSSTRGNGLIIDPFHAGAQLSEHDCRLLLEKHVGSELAFSKSLLTPATRPQIMVRMLLNLKKIYVHMRSFPQARDVTELLLALTPSALSELRDRGLLAYHLNYVTAALLDLQTYLKLASMSDMDKEAREEHQQIWEHVKTLRRRVAALN